MGQPLTNITIVGGGTAGWIAAAYLNERLQWGPAAHRDVTITVIESPSVGLIGVGEATVPTLKRTMNMLGISEPEFMERTNATFKLGIWFDKWNVNDKGDLIGFIHPFTGGLTVKGLNPGYSFKHYGVPGRDGITDQDFVRTIALTREAFESFKGPRALGGPDYGGALQYAYHIDAAKLAEFLADVCRRRGVKHVRDDVVDVKLNDRGFVEALQLKEKGTWPIEFVIDCTGFRGIIINKALGEPFESYSEYLLNDRAIPMQVPHVDATRIAPVTGAIAMDAGWVWHIPLHKRVGTGYVFCSRFKSDDEALDEFLKHLGPVAEGITPQPTIKMRVGRNRRSFVKNCAAIGLASGFLEPLESTAIMSLELQSRWLVSCLPSTDFEEPLANQYNAATARLYDEIRDFLSLHFSLSERKGAFWDAVRNEAKKSDNLLELLDLWKYSLPTPLDARHRAVYNHWSVTCILMGKNFYRDSKLSGAETVSLRLWQQYLQQFDAVKGRLLPRLANHNQLVEHMRKRAVAGESVRRKPDAGPVIGDGTLLMAPEPVLAQRPVELRPQGQRPVGRPGGQRPIERPAVRAGRMP
jgi:tryptophan halogenase